MPREARAYLCGTPHPPDPPEILKVIPPGGGVSRNYLEWWFDTKKLFRVAVKTWFFYFAHAKIYFTTVVMQGCVKIKGVLNFRLSTVRYRRNKAEFLRFDMSRKDPWVLENTGQVRYQTRGHKTSRGSVIMTRDAVFAASDCSRNLNEIRFASLFLCSCLVHTFLKWQVYLVINLFHALFLLKSWLNFWIFKPFQDSWTFLGRVFRSLSTRKGSCSALLFEKDGVQIGLMHLFQISAVKTTVVTSLCLYVFRTYFVYTTHPFPKAMTMEETESGGELVGGWSGRGRGLSPEQPAQPEQPTQSVEVTPRPYVQDAFRHRLVVPPKKVFFKSYSLHL